LVHNFSLCYQFKIQQGKNALLLLLNIIYTISCYTEVTEGLFLCQDCNNNVYSFSPASDNVFICLLNTYGLSH